MISNPAKRADACPQTLDSFLYSKLQVICVSLRNTFLQFQVELAMSSLYFSFLSALYSLFYSLTLFDINFSLTLAENSLLHKSKAVHGEGAMVRVDRKCEAYVGRRFAAALLPRLFGKNPRSHHKCATGRVRTGDQRLPVVCTLIVSVSVYRPSVAIYPNLAGFAEKRFCPTQTDL